MSTELTITTGTGTPLHIDNDIVLPDSFSFQSESLRNFAAAVATVAVKAETSAHEYRKAICRIFAERKIGADDYKADGFVGFKDFAHRVFNLSEANAYQYMGAGSIYTNPRFAENPIIESLPVATVYVLTGLTDEELAYALDNGKITDSTTQTEVKAYVAAVKSSRITTPAPDGTSTPDGTHAQTPDSTPAPDGTSTPDGTHAQTPDSPQTPAIAREYRAFITLYSTFHTEQGSLRTIEMVGTWNEIEDRIFRELPQNTDIEWGKDYVRKNPQGKEVGRVRLFTELNGLSFGQIRYSRLPKTTHGRGKGKNNAVSMEDYQALQKRLRELEAQLHNSQSDPQ